MVRPSSLVPHSLCAPFPCVDNSGGSAPCTVDCECVHPLAFAVFCLLPPHTVGLFDQIL